MVYNISTNNINHIQLTFNTHITEKIKKASSISAMIRRIFQHLDEKTFTPLYKALARTHLEYACSAWAPYKVKYIDMIEMYTDY